MKSKTDIKSLKIDNVTIVVRTAGERTIEICKKMIEEQGYTGNIFLTSEVPFSKAIRKAFEIGIAEGRVWTFCVDADLLLREESISKLLQFAENQPQNVFEVQGFVYDKFFNIPRQAGNHLYRTSMLTQALKLIPSEGLDIRPESYMLRSMQDRGFPYVHFPVIIGLHDFEQFYFDIYRKAFVQAHKHLQYTENMVPLWKDNIKSDMDYEVALRGFTDGLLNNNEVFIDKNHRLYEDNFQNINIIEKKLINIKKYNLNDVENILKEGLKDNYVHLSKHRLQKNTISKLLLDLKENGLFKFMALKCASLLIKTGRTIKSKIN